MTNLESNVQRRIRNCVAGSPNGEWKAYAGSARDNFRRIVSQMLFERVLHRVGAATLLPIVILHRVREAGPSVEPFQVLTVVQLAVSKVSG